MPDDAAAPVIPCLTQAKRELELCLPVTISPFARTNGPSVRCCGPAILGNIDQCRGTPNGTCDFNIIQRICVEVPVEFGADTEVGEVHVDCGEPSPNACANCPVLGTLDPEDPDNPIDPDDE